MSTEVAALMGAVTILSSVVAYMYKQIVALQSENTRCRQETAYLTGEVYRLSGEVQRLSSSFDDDPSEGKLAIDQQTGLIIRWSPGATAMFHWTAREIIGKGPSLLVPPRFLDNHNRAWNKFLQEGRPPRGEPVVGWARMKPALGQKDGDEIPVEIYLSCWREKDKTIVGARIRRRLTEPLVISPDSPKVIDSPRITNEPPNPPFQQG